MNDSVFDNLNSNQSGISGGPLDTVVANSMGRSTGDTAFRDMIGDTTGGAMGTHIGNHQGISSNIQSEYNRASMTEAQLNMNMIDAARGYGQGSGHASAESMFAQTSMNSSHHMDTAFDSMSPSANHGQSMFSNGSPYDANQGAFENNAMGYGGHTTGVVAGVVTTHSIIRRKAAVVGGTQQIQTGQEHPKDDQLEQQANKSDTESKADDGSAKSIDDKNGATSNIEHKKNNTKQPTEKSSGDGLQLRPIKPPKSAIDMEKKQKRQSTKREALQTKLMKMDENELGTLIEKVQTEAKEAKSPEREIIARSKLQLLKNEVKRRLQ